MINSIANCLSVVGHTVRSINVPAFVSRPVQAVRVGFGYLVPTFLSDYFRRENPLNERGVQVLPLPEIPEPAGPSAALEQDVQASVSQSASPAPTLGEGIARLREQRCTDPVFVAEDLLGYEDSLQGLFAGLQAALEASPTTRIGEADRRFQQVAAWQNYFLASIQDVPMESVEWGEGFSFTYVFDLPAMVNQGLHRRTIAGEIQRLMNLREHAVLILQDGKGYPILAGTIACPPLAVPLTAETEVTLVFQSELRIHPNQFIPLFQDVITPVLNATDGLQDWKIYCYSVPVREVEGWRPE